MFAVLTDGFEPVIGYVGPAGIGAIGVLIVVVLVLLIGALGLVLHPMRVLIRFLQNRKTDAPVSTQSGEDYDRHE